MALVSQTLYRGSGFAVRRVDCRPADLSPSDVERNPGPTLVFPLAGRFRKHVSRRRTFLADATQVAFFNEGEPYQVSHVDVAGDRCLALDLDRSWLEGELEALAPAALDRALGGLPLFEAPFAPLEPAALGRRSLLDWRLRAGLATALEIEEQVALLIDAALHAGRARREPAPPKRRSTSSFRRERVEVVQRMVEGDPGSDLRLADLARAAHVAPCHLAVLFREEVGLPIHRYRQRVRLARSLEPILAGERELSAIAMDLGFATPSHFAASFRAAFGRSPRDFRGAARRRATRAAENQAENHERI